MTASNPALVNLDVGMGLIVQLKLAEARDLIPKLKDLLKEKLEQAVQDLAKAYDAKKAFEESYLMMQLALDPIVSRLGV
jgi:prefoldin subunit 5